MIAADERRCPMAPEEGFTLLEIIVTLVVASILGAILVEFMGTGMMRSAEPLLSMQKGMKLVGAMERISADYLELRASDEENGTAEALSTLKTRLTAPVHISYHLETGVAPQATAAYINLSLSGSDWAESAPTDPTNILKVTLAHGDLELTTLFTR